MPKNVMITEYFVKLDYAPCHPETRHTAERYWYM